MSDAEDARKQILARRAKFIAAALAGVSVGASSCAKPDPFVQAPVTVVDGGDGIVTAPDSQPLKKHPPPAPTTTTQTDDDDNNNNAYRDAGIDPAPMVCLSPMPNPTQAPPVPTSTSTSKKPKAPPRPCLLFIINDHKRDDEDG